MQARDQSVVNNQLLAGHDEVLAELQNFRVNPSSIVPYLKLRTQRYKTIQGNQYLFSLKHKKKAIQVDEQQKSESRIRELIGILLGQINAMPPLQPVAKLDELALKLCLTILPQIRNAIHFKPSTNLILRQLLEKDPNNIYPGSVACLISLGFDQPYQSLVNLLIDEGVKNRSNRNTLLNYNLKYVGVASAVSPSDPQLRCTVYVLTDVVISKSTIAQSTISKGQIGSRSNQNSMQPKISSYSGQTGRFPSYQQTMTSNIKNINESNSRIQNYQFAKPNNGAAIFDNNNIKEGQINSQPSLKHSKQDQLIKQRSNALIQLRPTQQESIQFRDNLVSKSQKQHEYFPFNRNTFSLQSSNQMNALARNTQNEKIKINFNNSQSVDPYMNTSVDPFQNKSIQNRPIRLLNEKNILQEIPK